MQPKFGIFALLTLLATVPKPLKPRQAKFVKSWVLWGVVLVGIMGLGVGGTNCN